jgi:hypothetical protein
MSVRHREDSIAAMRAGRPTPQEAKVKELAAAATAAIYAGVTVETTRGAEHFALTQTDQTNLAKLAQQAQAGASVLYHADRELCRIFAPEELLAIVAAAISHVTWHTTWVNHLNVWARRTEDAEELAAIHYGATLPDDLAASFETLMGGLQT